MGMKDCAREMISRGDGLFAKRRPLDTLWQTLCENFHVMRADFTRSRYMSEEFASFLMTGRPALAHRALSNAIPALMRPRDRQWLWARTNNQAINSSPETRGYLDFISRVQYSAMYSPHSGFVRSCKEADGDYAAIGNAVISVEPNETRSAVLQRCWHPRDVVWTHDHAGRTNQVHHRKKLSIRDRLKLYPQAEDVERLRSRLKDEADVELNCRRFVVPSDEYDGIPIRNKARFPYVVVDVDLEHDVILAEIPSRTLKYVIPGWARVSGSQYAYSLATVYALPDARMLQQITLTMLEAGQKATDPPMIAVTEAINGAVNSGAGMITWTDADYDERTGEVLRPMEMRFDGIKYGAEREERIEATIDATFFTNDLRFPQITKEMTAFEASKLYEEYARNSLPLLEPIEVDYNAALCDAWYEELQALGSFGPPTIVPEALQSQPFQWEFDTPLKAAAEQAKVFAFQNVTDIIAKAMQIDQNAVLEVDTSKMTREAIVGANGAEWLRPSDDVAKLRQQKQQQAQATEAANAMAHGADVATRVSTAMQSAAEAGKSIQGAQ